MAPVSAPTSASPPGHPASGSARSRSSVVNWTSAYLRTGEGPEIIPDSLNWTSAYTTSSATVAPKPCTGRAAPRAAASRAARRARRVDADLQPRLEHRGRHAHARRADAGHAARERREPRAGERVLRHLVRRHVPGRRERMVMRGSSSIPRGAASCARARVHGAVGTTPTTDGPSPRYRPRATRPAAAARARAALAAAARGGGAAAARRRAGRGGRRRERGRLSRVVAQQQPPDRRDVADYGHARVRRRRARRAARRGARGRGAAEVLEARLERVNRVERDLLRELGRDRRKKELGEPPPAARRARRRRARSRSGGGGAPRERRDRRERAKASNRTRHRAIFSPKSGPMGLITIAQANFGTRSKQASVMTGFGQ